eukprot:10971025-Heterocapsa_arctica.AAC.1
MMENSARQRHWFRKLRQEENLPDSKCYERVNHKLAAKAAVNTGCNSAIVTLSFATHRRPRVIQVHKANTEGIPANRSIMAGCGYAVHYLKAMIKQEVQGTYKELGDFVDDMVLLKEEATETQAV